MLHGGEEHVSSEEGLHNEVTRQVLDQRATNQLCGRVLHVIGERDKRDGERGGLVR